MPRSARYLSPLGLSAALVPGRGGGVGPEAALAGQRRNGRRRLQGHVGFGEGRSRRARLLRRAGAGGVRAEKEETELEKRPR